MTSAHLVDLGYEKLPVQKCYELLSRRVLLVNQLMLLINIPYGINKVTITPNMELIVSKN